MSIVDTRENIPILQLKAIAMQRSLRVRRAAVVTRRKTRVTVIITETISFLTSPYDNPLFLSNKEVLKLLNDVCNGLQKYNRFDGKIINASKFLPSIGKQLEECRLDDILKVSMSQDEGADNSTALAKSANELEEFNVVDEVITMHCDLFWAKTGHGADTPFCHAKCEPLQNTAEKLRRSRNDVVLKHTIGGKKLWNSLTTSFQEELMKHSEEFK